MTKYLTKKEEEMLFDYERKFGKDKADTWRQKLLDATPEEVENEIQESAKIPDITQMKSWSKILKSADAKAYLKLFVKFIQITNEVRDLPDFHGYTFMLIRTPKNIVLIKKDEIAVNPDSTENILKGEDEMPSDRIVAFDNDEEEEE